MLDVGCSAGALAAALRARGATVDGIEADAAAADMARRSCRTVITADLETLDPRVLGDSRYDAIVCADVLEHVRDPALALRRLVPLLEPGGWVVISTPNIANWSVRLLLLAGRFEYRDRGILDRTHVHLFTRRSLLHMLAANQLSVSRFDVTCPVPVLRRQPFTRWAHHAARALPGLLAYQFVVVARPVDG